MSMINKLMCMDAYYYAFYMYRFVTEIDTSYFIYTESLQRAIHKSTYHYSDLLLTNHYCITIVK